jgi:hypothetical protein
LSAARGLVSSLQFHPAVVSQDSRRPQRKMKYRNVVPGLALLAALATVMAGVTAVRLGFVAVEIKRGPRLTGAGPVARPAEPPRVTVTPPAPAAPARPRVRQDTRLTSASIVLTAHVPPSSTLQAPPLDEAPASPAKPAPVITALPGKALAVSTGAAKRVAECATMVASAAVNIDPTNGEISGSTGLPDQVSYFKAKGGKTHCR